MSSQPANPETEIPTRVRVWEFWKRNQILVHMALQVAFLFSVYVLLKSIDPRIGVEGFGDLFGYLLNSVRATMIIFTAIWMKKWLFFSLHDRTELELFRDIVVKGDAAVERYLWRDRAEWFGLFALSTYWFTR